MIPFWFDQVCIDQTSTADKEAQIALMARIYGQAQRVFVWIGPQAGDSELARHIIRLNLDKDSISDIVRASNGASGACPAGMRMLKEGKYRARIVNSLKGFSPESIGPGVGSFKRSPIQPRMIVEPSSAAVNNG